MAAAEVGRLRAVFESVGADKVVADIKKTEQGMAKVGQASKDSSSKLDAQGKAAQKAGSDLASAATKGAAAQKQVGTASDDAKGKLDAQGKAGKAAGEQVAAGATRAVSGTKQVASAGEESRGILSRIGDAAREWPSKIGAAASNVKAKLSQIQDAVQEHEQSISAVGSTFTRVGLLATAGLGVIVKANMDFEKSMSQVKADTHETADNMNLLRDAAVDAGAKTSFSATSSAQAIDELAKAGVSTQDILSGGLSGALDLAAAGSLDVGQAAEIAATALSTFGLSGDQMGHVADLLAAGAGKAQGSVNDLSQALNQSALVAKNTGLNIDETTGALAMFASKGLIGSDAGTSFKSMLQALNPNSKEAAKLMKDLNIQAYDQQGKFVGLSQYAQKLKDGLSGLSEEQRNAALKTIFGSDAVRAATILYEGGADGVNQWTDAVNDAGYAADTASTMQDNLAGDLEKLGGSFESVFLKSGSGANEVLRDMVQKIGDVVDWVGTLDTDTLNNAVTIAGWVAGIGLGVGALTKLVTGVSNTIETIKDLSGAFKGLKGAGDSIDGIGGKVDGLSGKLSAAKVGVAGLEIAMVLAMAGSTELGESGEQAVARITKAVMDAKGGTELLGSSWQTVARDLGNGKLSEPLDQLGQALGKVAEADLPKAQDAFARMAATYGLNNDQLAQALDQMPAYKAELERQITAAGGVVTQQSLMAQALGDTGLAADGTTRQVNGVTYALQKIPGQQTTTMVAVDQASGKIDVVDGKLRYIDHDGVAREVEITANTIGATQEIDGVTYELMQIPGTTETTLVAQGDDALKTIDGIQYAVQEIDGKNVLVKVNADGAKRDLNDVSNLKDQIGQDQSFDLTAKDQATTTINGVEYLLATLPDGSSTLIAQDQATAVINGVTYSVAALPDGKTTLIAKDQASVVIDGVTYKVETMPDGHSTLTADDQASAPAGDALDAVNAIPQSWNTDINADNNVGAPTASAASMITGVPDRNSQLNASNNTAAPTAGATGNVNGIPDRNAQLNASNNTGGATAGATGNINRVPGWHDTAINAQDNASSVASTVLGWINRIPLTRTITIAAQKVGDFVGGLFNADGNVYAPAQPTRHYAWGGIETHTAHIAAGGGMRRVFNEEETGGEAYIPLAASKRVRSAALLGQTAAIFGYDLVPRGSRRVAFADGGTVGAHPKPVDTSAQGAPQVVSVTQRITTQQDDPRVQARQWAREAEKAFAGGGIR
ncbi:phage tail tape measure protein [Pseudoclavibacter sp. CFCC 14310]|uniref:phage tail tape measure protein n=1 Tax=Pseudoclavibacter sp. CFCC 14310 TaxID=2615180 RepID=UPI00130143F8|nr:phage tail tape measure protein [Pseudoclavibacter sp. CFCC 14310]KAB1647469.1 phage tail tape measure protein [Pseudoclavibacter sp. CFCC 14310]